MLVAENEMGVSDELKTLLAAWIRWQCSVVGFRLSGINMASFLHVFDDGGRVCFIPDDEDVLWMERAMLDLKRRHFKYYVAVVLYYSEPEWSNPMCAAHLGIGVRQFVENKMRGEIYLDGRLSDR